MILGLRKRLQKQISSAGQAAGHGQINAFSNLVMPLRVRSAIFEIGVDTFCSCARNLLLHVQAQPWCFFPGYETSKCQNEFNFVHDSIVKIFFTWKKKSKQLTICGRIDDRFDICHNYFQTKKAWHLSQYIFYSNILVLLQQWTAVSLGCDLFSVRIICTHAPRTVLP